MDSRRQTLMDAMAALGLGQHPQSLINGPLTDGSGVNIQLADPFTETHLLSHADADAALATQACEPAQSAQAGWANGILAAWRGHITRDISHAILANAVPLATIEAIIAGKPIRNCRIKVAQVAEMFAFCAGWARKPHGEVIPVPSGHLN